MKICATLLQRLCVFVGMQMNLNARTKDSNKVKKLRLKHQEEILKENKDFFQGPGEPANVPKKNAKGESTYCVHCAQRKSIHLRKCHF